jgi:multiple antibiotic resistance protein
MSEVVNSFLLVFAGLFPIVNPLGTAPLFLSLTRDCSTAERNHLAWRVALNGFLLLLGSLLLGSKILEFFGISLPVVRVAGGLVVTTLGWKLLSEGEDTQDRRAASGMEGSLPRDGFYPLTMPLTVGPGSIAVAITLGSHRPQLQQPWSELALLGGGAITGLLAIAASIYVSFRFAYNVMSVLGPGGTNVLVRLSAFILLCIGIEILWSGAGALLATVPR